MAQWKEPFRFKLQLIGRESKPSLNLPPTSLVLSVLCFPSGRSRDLVRFFHIVWPLSCYKRMLSSLRRSIVFS